MNLRVPAGITRGEHPEGVAVLGRGAMRRTGEVTVGLVDEHEMGELDDPTLDALELVARPRREE